MLAVSAKSVQMKKKSVQRIQVTLVGVKPQRRVGAPTPHSMENLL